MSPHCDTRDTLRRLAGGSADRHLAGAAAASLAILQDIDNQAMSAQDIDLLQDLVEAIYREGNLALLEHLRSGAPDCAVCAVLALRMAELD